MAKNLMPEIMKMLGVEYNEKFKVDTHGTEFAKGNLFCFNENNGLLMVYPDGVSCGANELVYGILCGYYKIVKLPWEPKFGEPYWTISFSTNFTVRVIKKAWEKECVDFALLRLGMVYRTMQEAADHMAKDYERLTGKQLSSR